MKTTVIQIRVSPDEKARIEASAKAVGLSTSKWMRHVLLDKPGLEQVDERGVPDPIPPTRARGLNDAPRRRAAHHPACRCELCR